jgi:hypothetical protein
MSFPGAQGQEPPGPGWWLASDGNWYPPEARPSPPTSTQEQQPPAINPPVDLAQRTKLLVAFTYVAIGLAFVASFMPWASVLVFTVDGTQGDGKVTLVLSLIAAAFVLAWHVGSSKQPVWLVLALLTSLGIAGVYLYDLINVSRVAHANADPTATFSIHVDVGSGLYLGALASSAAVVLICILAASTARSRDVA